MKLVNLIIGQKRNLMNNLKSISNCQSNKFKNINFFIFWEDDSLNNQERKVIIEKYENTYFKSIKKNKFENKIKKILKNKKNYTKNIKNTIIRNYLQYSLVQYAFIYASKKLKNENYENFFWQRIRSDTYVKDKIIDNPQKKMLYLPGTAHGYGIIDFHAIGTYEEIKIYSNMIETLNSLYKTNIFVPPEIALRMHLNKFKIRCILTNKMPTALLKNSSKKRIKIGYNLSGNKHLTNEFSNNILEENFAFKNNFILRKIYYFCYNLFIKAKLILNI